MKSGQVLWIPWARFQLKQAQGIGIKETGQYMCSLASSPHKGCHSSLAMVFLLLHVSGSEAPMIRNEGLPLARVLLSDISEQHSEQTAPALRSVKFPLLVPWGSSRFWSLFMTVVLISFFG